MPIAEKERAEALADLAVVMGKFAVQMADTLKEAVEDPSAFNKGRLQAMLAASQLFIRFGERHEGLLNGTNATANDE